jgi:hypothetical protein
MNEDLESSVGARGTARLDSILRRGAPAAGPYFAIHVFGRFPRSRTPRHSSNVQYSPKALRASTIPRGANRHTSGALQVSTLSDLRPARRLFGRRCGVPGFLAGLQRRSSASGEDDLPKKLGSALSREREQRAENSHYRHEGRGQENFKSRPGDWMGVRVRKQSLGANKSYC